MKSPNQEFELYVLVENKPIKEYYHEGGIFVEGRVGSEYTIRVRNSAAHRALFVLSVDGLSVLDGEQCSDQSPGYVISGGDTLDVQCYRVDDSTGAKFVFGTKDESYSAQVGHGVDNVGVIGAKVFREKQKSIYSVDAGWSYPKTFRNTKLGAGPTGLSGTGPSGGGWSHDSMPRGIMPRGIACGASGSTSFGTMSTNSTNSTLPVEEIIPATMDWMSTEAADDKLGTVFGDAMKWDTTTIKFERASTLPDASLVVYYDTRKNLERRGIKFRKETAPLPNPFPANPPGCPTPPGWHK